jgi:hypothetical protein
VAFIITRHHHDVTLFPALQGFVLEFLVETSCTYPVRDGNLGFFVSVVWPKSRGYGYWRFVLSFTRGKRS